MNAFERIRIVTPLRIAVAAYTLVLLAVLASGCACTCPPPGYYGSVSAPAAAGSTPTVRAPSSTNRAPSYYDRYREERHRREVEKQLRDIKRNTQPPRR